MDGQTDRILIARPRLHPMQRGKKINCYQPYIAVHGRSCQTSAAVLCVTLF